jgi:proton-dependent oligopeptide transporter, POT family
LSAIPADQFCTFWFSQPKGFGRICLTKFWERLAYYGLQAILVLYLTEYLFAVRAPNDIWLLTPLSQLLNVEGQALASTVTGGFLMLIAIIPVFGGIITDKFLGKSRAIILGGSVMAFGHLLMAIEQALILALLCIALGVGLFRGAIASELGSLYENDSQRVEGFQLYFLAVNFAGLAAPFVIGTVGEEIGWHWGFATAGIAMLIALLSYSSGLIQAVKASNADEIAPQKVVAAPTKPRWRSNILLIAAVGLLAIPNFQLFNAYMIWVKRDFALQIFGQQMPVSWLIGLDAALSISVLVASVPAWRWLEGRAGPVSSLSRATIGALFVCAAAAVLVCAAVMPSDGKLTLIWCVLFQLLNAIGLAQILPAAMARLGARENSKGSATSISGYFFGLFIAGLMSTILAARFETMAISTFWALHLACALGGATILYLANRTSDRFSVEAPTGQ